MTNISIQVHNANGLDARLAGQLVKEAIACDGDVRIRCGQKTGNAKMIFNVLSLHARQGDTLEIELTGARREEDAERLMLFAERNI